MSKQFNNFRVIKQKTSNFTIVDNKLIRDNNLSLKARGLLVFMLQLPDTWEFSEMGLAKVTGEGIRSIRSGIKELMDCKYLYRFQARNEGNTGFGKMVYYLFEEPTDVAVEGQEEAPTEAPATENASYILDKNNPDYDYFNGGWMNE